MFQSLGARSYETQARISLARNYLIRAQYQAAKEIYDPIIKEVQRKRDPRIERVASNHLAVIHMCLGEFEDAMACAQRSVELCEADGDQARAGDNLSVCGIILNEVGQFAVAADYFSRALSLHRETNSRWSEADCLIYAGTNACMLGEMERGMERLALARHYAEGLGAPYVLINAGIARSEALLMRAGAGDFEEALEDAKRATTLAREAGLAGALTMALSFQAQALHRLGLVEEAMERSSEAMEILDRQTHVEGSEERIVLTHFLLQEESGDPTAPATLKRAMAGFDRKLASIQDPNWRSSFCSAVATNAALLDLVEETTF